MHMYHRIWYFNGSYKACSPLLCLFFDRLWALRDSRDSAGLAANKQPEIWETNHRLSNPTNNLQLFGYSVSVCK
jgi:hypothetical protein